MEQHQENIFCLTRDGKVRFYPGLVIISFFEKHQYKGDTVQCENLSRSLSEDRSEINLQYSVHM